MVLSRVLLCVALVAGCKQSLFDNGAGDDDTPNPDGNTGNGDGSVVPSSCPAMCLADAAADFGMTTWRYLDDFRNRTWMPMTAGSGEYTGAGSNRIAPCGGSTSGACGALQGALLVATSGGVAAADPAISYTATANQVIQLTVRVHVPSGGAEHTVRLYRNSREDALVIATAQADGTFQRTITVDALTGDRFYLALDPVDPGTQGIAVHFYVNGTEDTFPKTCRLAITFNAASGVAVPNFCGGAFTYYDYNLTPAQTPTLTAGPFPDMGMAADIPMDRYYEGSSVVARGGDTTTQLWVRHDAFVPSYNAAVFSDSDLDAGGGVLFYLRESPALKWGGETCTNGNPLAFQYGEADWPNDHAWHFLRAVHTNGSVQVCLDGKAVASYPLAAGKMQSTYHPFIGKNVVWTPSGAFFDGAVDDIRVIDGALPCEQP